MIIQKRTDIFGDIGHPVKSIRLTQIDPFKNLIGTIGLDLMIAQPGNQFFTLKFKDVLLFCIQHHSCLK